MEEKPTSCTIDIIHQMAVVAKTADSAGSARKRSMLILDTFLMLPSVIFDDVGDTAQRIFLVFQSMN